MRIMGGWIALTPEVPAKLLLGRHVWECAQHADAWGRRLPELREPAHESAPANQGVVRFMDLLEACEGPGDTLERLTAVYRVLKPHLVAVYEHHFRTANAVYEPPTLRILTRCLDDERRHVAAGAIVLRHLGADGTAASRIAAWQRRLEAVLAEAGGVTGDGVVAIPAAIDVTAARAEADVVLIDPKLDATRIDEALAALLDRHAREMRAADRMLGEPEIVAVAKIGKLRMTKIRFRGAHGTTTVQLRCEPVRGGWRVAAAETIRTEPAP